jgi:hypothetical protein
MDAIWVAMVVSFGTALVLELYDFFVWVKWP